MHSFICRYFSIFAAAKSYKSNTLTQFLSFQFYSMYASGTVQTPTIVSGTMGGTVAQTNSFITNSSGPRVGYGFGNSNVQVIPAPVQPQSRSRIEYIPVQQKVVDYETREWIETVPRQKTVTEYQQRRWTEQVPREVTKVDYYALEYLREFAPQVIATNQIQMMPQQNFIERTNSGVYPSGSLSRSGISYGNYGGLSRSRVNIVIQPGIAMGISNMGMPPTPPMPFAMSINPMGMNGVFNQTVTNTFNNGIYSPGMGVGIGMDRGFQNMGTNMNMNMRMGMGNVGINPSNIGYAMGMGMCRDNNFMM